MRESFVLVRNQITLHRDIPSRLSKIDPEHGPRTLGFVDYADAFSGSSGFDLAEYLQSVPDCRGRKPNDS
jgi:hypothetical protein